MHRCELHDEWLSVKYLTFDCTHCTHYARQGFKNFLRKLRGEKLSAPLTSLGGEPDIATVENSQGNELALMETENQGNGQSRNKEGCGGPGGMCCCPCGALKSSADGESKKKMEKVLCTTHVMFILNNMISHIPCLMQLELTLLRIESRLKDTPDHHQEWTVDDASFMVDVDEIE
jgi:hypothetical protein